MLRHTSISFQYLKVILCSVIVGMSLSTVHSQEQFSTFKHISTSDGFSLIPVNSIDQDEDGFIWLGSRRGLLRYDGSELRVVRRLTGVQEQQNFNDIYAIQVDTSKGIWIASKRGLDLYDHYADSLKSFGKVLTGSQAIASGWVYDVQVVSKNEIWIATRHGVDVYNLMDGSISTFNHDPDDDESLSSNIVNRIYKLSDGSIWIATQSGLNKFIGRQEGKLRFKRYVLSIPASTRTSHNNINCIQEDDNGKLWVGTQGGLFYKQKGQNHFESFEYSTGQELTNEIVQDLTLDHSNRLWVGTYEGLNIIDDELNVVTRVKHDPEKRDGLTGNSIRSLFTDKQGGVWIATYFGGINYWSENLVNFERIDESSGTQLEYNVVSSIVEAEDAKIYYGTEGAGINVHDPSTNEYEKIDELAEGNSIGAVKTLLYEGEGRFWIGTLFRGLIFLDINNGKFKEYQYLDNRNSISSNRILDLERGDENKIWIATLNRGLNLFDPETGHFTDFRQGHNVGITSNNVRSLLFDTQGDLYVGTGGGLCVLSGDDFRNNKIQFKRFEIEGVQENMIIHDIIEDRNGKKWVGTESEGLFYVDGNKLVSAELPGITTVFAIVEYPDGTLWVSSEEGVVSYNPSTDKFQLYDRKDGVQPNEFNRAAKLSASDGRVYFGGASGVTAFHPDNLVSVDNQALDVVITKFLLSDQELKAHDDTGILKKPIEFTDEITLDYDQNIFSIHFVMPNYLSADKDAYLYRLRGLDDTWVSSANPFVSYTIQRGDDYVFEVKGVNSAGIEASKVTTLNITVKNPPWLTGWAYFLYFVLISGALITFIFFFRSRLILKHQLEIETREHQQQEEVHQQKLRFFTNISHEFRTPLTLISGPLEKLISEYKGPSKVYRQLLVIKRNTDQLFKLINELMDFRKLENKQMKLQAAEGDIVKFTKEIYLSFDQQAKLNDIDYFFESEESEINVYFDRDKLEKVLFNLISNAFKYAGANSNIDIFVTQDEENVSIHVKDNGEGIAQEEIDKIFERFYEIPKPKNEVKLIHGTGIGLSIAKNIMELHKGELQVESELGKGTEFYMTLKKGKDHLTEDEISSSFVNSEDVSHYSIDPSSVDIEALSKLDLEEPDETTEKRTTVLVVEDNEEISRLMKDVLGNHYNVCIAENGAEGYKQALSVQPDLILSDVMMPIMDGIELCSKVKSDIRTSHIPFILLTARTSLVYKYDGLESGADEYLSKPFELKELLLKCKNLINTQEKLKKKFAESGELGEIQGAVSSLDEVMMKKAIQIIRENIGNEFFGIQLLCDELGMSRSLLFTKFKAWTNQTPNDYILSTRMKHAASLIEQNKVNISQVGYMVGFKSANYFSKSFRKYHSMSPTTYAKKFSDSLEVE